MTSFIILGSYMTPIIQLLSIRKLIKVGLHLTFLWLLKQKMYRLLCTMPLYISKVIVLRDLKITKRSKILKGAFLNLNNSLVSNSGTELQLYCYSSLHNLVAFCLSQLISYRETQTYLSQTATVILVTIYHFQHAGLYHE